jgi:hypothetical protein
MTDQLDRSFCLNRGVSQTDPSIRHSSGRFAVLADGPVLAAVEAIPCLARILQMRLSACSQVCAGGILVIEWVLDIGVWIP